MSDSIRAALERLLSDIQDLSDSSQGIVGLHRNGDPAPWNELLEGGRYSSWLGDAITAARAALAEQQGEGPSDKELNILWNCSGIADEHGNHTGNIFEFARAVLARYGHQPTPPAEGEVAELLAELEVAAVTVESEGGDHEAAAVRRAAELLQQQHPTPVPVSEGAPGPEDCDVEGRCWQWTPFEEGTNFPAPGDWGLQFGEWLSNVHCETTHWLPAHALPLPQGEVEK